MAREADALRGEQDTKLVEVRAAHQEAAQGGFSPIVFCRFIPTAEYVADELRERAAKGVTDRGRDRHTAPRGARSRGRGTQHVEARVCWSAPTA